MRIKSLHVCNVANMAYAYGKLLMQQDMPVQVCCNNITHLMSQPEWDDLDLCPEDFQNVHNFYANTAKLTGYQRPDWYQSDTVSAFNHPYVLRFSQLFSHALRQKLKPLYFAICKWFSSGTQNQHIDTLVNFSKQFGPEWEVTSQEIHLFLRETQWLSTKIIDQDVIFAYMNAPILAMILNQKPYVSVEIGTMRDVFYRKTYAAKLLALAYRLSSHIIITNPDVQPLAEQLGLSGKYTFCPHPIDEDIYKPLARIEDKEKIKIELNIPTHYDVYLFAPARQNWSVKGNDKYLYGLKKLLAENINALLIIPAWGQEVSRSKKLASQLELDSHILWIKPVSEKRLIKYIQIADIVLDQFQLGVFGLITAKALACGTPVITSYDTSVHAWCFKKNPPVMRANTAEDISKQLQYLCQNTEKKLEIGKLSRDWIMEYYSKVKTTQIFSEVMRTAIQNFEEKAS